MHWIGSRKVVTRLGVMLMMTIMATSLRAQLGNGSVPTTGSKSFYSMPMAGIAMSQIDGDQASGYNHFGLHVGVITGLTVNHKNISSVELQMAYVQRGSRRSFDPITMLNQFNINANQFEVGMIMKLKAPFANMRRLSYYSGLRGSYLVNIVETEGYNPGIKMDYSKFGVLGEIAFGFQLQSKSQIRIIWDYSLISALRQGVKYNLYYTTGAHHNGISVIFCLKL